MYESHTPSHESSAAHSGHHASEKYCVFVHGQGTYALRALAVREVGPCPSIAVVPQSHPLLAGIGHLRNEFLPLIRLSSNGKTLGSHPRDALAQLIVVQGEQGPWGLLVDRVLGLRSLEVSLNGERPRGGSWTNSIMGTAACDHQIVQVVDDRALYRYLADLLESHSVSAP